MPKERIENCESKAVQLFLRLEAASSRSVANTPFSYAKVGEHIENCMCGLCGNPLAKRDYLVKDSIPGTQARVIIKCKRRH